MTNAPLHPEAASSLAFAVIASSRAPLLLLDGDLTVLAASASFCGGFGIDPGTVAGRKLPAIGHGEWNVPQLDALLRATVAGYAEIDAYEMDLEREGEGTRRVILSPQRLDYAERDAVRLILGVSDVTDARTNERLNDTLLREKAVLLEELRHRMANSLQIIASVLMLSARRVQSDETRSHLYDAHHRVMSIAALQQQLSPTRTSDVALRKYLTDLCASIGASMIHDHGQLSLEVRSDDTVVGPNVAMSLGLIVTELVINALKHAFPEHRKGRITVSFGANGSNWTLSVHDDGVGKLIGAEQTQTGLGTSIVEALVNQLSASLKVANTCPGTEISVVYWRAASVSGNARRASVARAA